MLKQIYNTSKGLTSNKITNRFVFGILLASFFTVFWYIAAYFNITWSESGTPVDVIFDNRNFSIVMYANTLAVLLYIVLVIKIYWLNIQSEVFFNKTSMKIFFVNNISGLKIYTYFVVKRLIELFIIDIILVLFLISVYVIKDQVIVFSLIGNIYVLFIVSALILVIYDILFFISAKSTSSSLLTFFIVILISILNFGIRPILGYSEYVDLVNLLPDLLSMVYQYLLLSFDASYSGKQIYYPIFFLVLGSLFLYRSSQNMLLRFSKN